MLVELLSVSKNVFGGATRVHVALHKLVLFFFFFCTDRFSFLFSNNYLYLFFLSFTEGNQQLICSVLIPALQQNDSVIHIYILPFLRDVHHF